jgi:hypothetical protein
MSMQEMGLARLYLSQDAVTRLTQFAKARLSDNVNNTESGLHSHGKPMVLNILRKEHVSAQCPASPSTDPNEDARGFCYTTPPAICSRFPERRA